ncbi:transmembrane anchor protein [Primorskyibacter aestuariivivens]|uniref:transmembrane anchor protein n=1 Tax=Primorskyibacter aestuariivivens TaxID=1888912 RepID=UPI0023019DE1|nr:transmembrane anchor protein [Primorskyibacter aestuariivivens]MDA7429103.1 transmembrane anchor protein [Primorskyibacter aestuariivivens]
MHNAPKPKLEDLPTKAQLRRSSVIAGIGAVFIGVAVYMPAELGQDPTGIGTILGLTEMGEIKQQLAAEAAADAELHGSDESSSLMDDIFSLFVSTAHAQEAWQDEIIFTLEPGEFTEIKATMEEGTTLFYAWKSTGGRVNFDLHAHAGGQDVTYEKGRGQTEGEGSFETPFAGNHGWFWRNRDDEAVTVTLQLRGDYSAIVRDE